MSIFTGNDYKRGFERGRKDALENKEKWDFKSSLASGLSWKFALHGSIAIDTFTEGYNKGYEEGLKEKNVVRKVEIVEKPKQKIEIKKSFSNNLNNNTMNQNYEHQLQALENLLSFLNQFQQDLGDRMRQYNDQVYGLRQSGLEQHISDNYDQNFCMPTNQKIYNIIENFEQRDFPFIKENIERVKEAWQAAQKNY